MQLLYLTLDSFRSLMWGSVPFVVLFQFRDAAFDLFRLTLDLPPAFPSFRFVRFSQLPVLCFQSLQVAAQFSHLAIRTFRSLMWVPVTFVMLCQFRDPAFDSFRLSFDASPVLMCFVRLDFR